MPVHCTLYYIACQIIHQQGILGLFIELQCKADTTFITFGILYRCKKVKGILLKVNLIPLHPPKIPKIVIIILFWFISISVFKFSFMLCSANVSTLHKWDISWFRVMHSLFQLHLTWKWNSHWEHAKFRIFRVYFSAI